MARERVYAQGDPTWSEPTSTSPGSAGAARRPGVEVTFHHDGAVVGLATGHLTDASFDEDELGTVTEAVATPYHVWLSRAEVNALVRYLRRARNAAWGADE